MITNSAKSYPNYQDLLKVIALIAMVIDHIGFFIMFPDGMWMRAVGRCVMPLFCFYVGFNYTKHKSIIGFLGFTLTYISYICFGAEHTMLNMLGMIYLGQWYLYLTDKYQLSNNKGDLIQCLILLALLPLVHKYIEYGTLGMVFMMIGKRARDGRNFKIFIPFACACSMIFAMTYFVEYFSIIDIALSLCTILITCTALYYLNHKALIKIDLRLISRNSLWIYFINYAGHLCWFYYTFLLKNS